MTGRERWHYRTAGAAAGRFTVSPTGDLVAFVGPHPSESSAAVPVVVLDAMTGAVILDQTRIRVDYTDDVLELTDHTLISFGNRETEVHAFDARTTERRWDYGLPTDCQLLDEHPSVVPGAGVVTVGAVCGPAAMIDTSTGATVLDTPGMQEDNFIDATPSGWPPPDGRPPSSTH